MSNSISKTIKALTTLGLDLKTGVSPEISITRIEALTGEKHTSNGSRIIRDDVAPFSFFKVERKYCGTSLHAVQFHGYRDVEFEFYETSNKIEGCKRKDQVPKEEAETA